MSLVQKACMLTVVSCKWMTGELPWRPNDVAHHAKKTTQGVETDTLQQLKLIEIRDVNDPGFGTSQCWSFASVQAP